MAHRKVQIALLGVTNHGVTIQNAIRDSQTLELISLHDIKREEGLKRAAELKVDFAESYEAMLADPRIEAVALVTPNHLHAAQVAAALDAGKHVFVEKPITRTVAEARRIIEHAGKVRRVLMVGHNTRRRPAFRKAKAIIDEKRLGIIAGVEMNMSRPAGVMAGLPEWKTDSRTTMLVPMTQLGIHFVETLSYLLGPIARVGCLAHHAAMQGSAWDTAFSILQLESGVPASLSSSYVTPDTYMFRIYGTKGILHCHASGFKLELLEEGRLRTEAAEEFPHEGFASYGEQMNEFGECVLSGRKPETGGEEGLHALAVIEAMVESAATRRIIELKEVLNP